MTAKFRVAWPNAKPDDWRDYDTEAEAVRAAGELVKSGRAKEVVFYEVQVEEGTAA